MSLVLLVITKVVFPGITSCRHETGNTEYKAFERFNLQHLRDPKGSHFLLACQVN
jgi:hypothetical protein